VIEPDRHPANGLATAGAHLAMMPEMPQLPYGAVTAPVPAARQSGPEQQQ
jgi:hypothetical protein